MKHGGSYVLVWGCTSAAGVGTLKFSDGLINHRIYIDILKRTLISSAEKKIVRGNFICMEDNDPKRTTYNTSVTSNLVNTIFTKRCQKTLFKFLLKIIL